MTKNLKLKSAISLLRILFLLLFAINANAQPPVKTMNLVTDFGAIGDSVTDNTDAFVKAGIFFSNFLTNDTTGILIIPSYHPINSTNPAVYKVGRQLVMNDSFIISTDYNGVTRFRKFKHWHTDQGAVSGLGDTTENYGMLALNNVHGMIIKGSDSVHPPTIRYKDSLMFGSFLNVGDTFTNGAFIQINPTNFTQPLIHYGYNQTKKTKGWIGHFITVQNSSQVTIKHLRIDGNNTAFKWGGTYSNNGGIQLPHAGIFCKNADTVSIKNVYACRFGFDGILLFNGNKHVTLDSCKFNENTRGGISWTGGQYVTAKYCEANENGRTVPISSLANPGTGIDIEPDFNADSCKFGYFFKCTFNNNLGAAISTNQIIAHKVYDMHFDSCTMYASREIGIFCTGKKYFFEDCAINAAVAWSSVDSNEANANIYKGCHFSDAPYNGTEYWTHNKPLISIPGAGDVGLNMKWTHFENCTFEVNDSLREFFYLNWHTNNMAKDEWTVLDNCSFNYNNKGRADTTFCSRLRGVRFKNSNKIENILNSTNSYHLFTTREAVVEGNNTGCEAGALKFEGQVEHVMMSSNLGAVDTFHIGKKIDGTDGYASYEIGDRALTFIETATHVKIGNYSAMRALKGGSLLSNNKFYFGGQLTFDAGSYVTFSNASTQYISTAINPYDLLYVDRLCNYNNTTMSPIWTNGEGYAAGANIENFVASWFGNYAGTPPCLQGNHPQLINANISCDSLYTHILTHGAKTLLYNLQVPCVGSTADIKFTVQGGIRPFTYKLNGVATDSVLTNVAAGIDTITVTDANACTDTFIVKMDTALTYKIVKGCVSGTPAKFKTNACTQPTVTGPGNISYSNDTVTVTSSGTYTITSSGKTVTLYIGSCSNCTNAPDTAEWKLPNENVTTLFPDGIIPLTNIVLQGEIEIDTILVLNNQRDIYCTANTQLIVTDSYTFICGGTKMRGCTDNWKGIKADGFSKSVIINNASTLQDMSEGVHIMNNAFLQARNSTYHNNTTGIFFENIKEPAYKSAITHNTFSSDTTILNNGCAGLTGILAFNCTDIEIGDSLIATSGNNFHDLYAGILITGDTNMPYVLNNNTSRIGIYNNKFSNITNCSITGSYPENQKINGCYVDFFGAGVYANFGMMPSTFDARVDIRNTNDTNTVIRFEKCDKAIVTKNTSVVAKNLYLNNNLMGIMCNGTTSKTLKIEKNYFKNGIIGMQFIGNNTNSFVRNNTIDSLIQTGYQKGIADYGWGTGIDIRHFTNADTSLLEVKDNIITVGAFAGRGINMENTGKNVTTIKNDIALTTSGTGIIVCAGATLLNGISATNIYNSVLYKNHITGNDSINATEREDAAGILINNSNKPRVECNIAERTRFGIQAISQCPTDTDGVKGNAVHEQVIGWTFRHLGTEGTFGNVGTLQSDNHNLWTGNGQLYKVFKFCDSSQPFKIYTNINFLDQPESNSENINTQVLNDCRYLVQDNTGATVYTCPINFNFQQPFIVNSSGHFALAEAISIATQTKSYSEFPEIAYWMDARKLYHDLDNSASYRNSNDTLLAFYDSLNTAVIEHIEATETNIANLIQSMNSQNYELYLQRLEEAKVSNSNVVSNRDQENNEHDINAIYIKIISYGIDALNDEDSTRIVEFANLCPYIGGTAVYKARALYAMYNPASMFDDITICNAIGVYKNGNSGNSKGIFDNENAYLKSLKPKENLLTNNGEHAFMLYPNPATTTVTIAYELNQNEKANVIVNDILGREQMKIDLHPAHNIVSINVSLLRQGIYIYKYLVNNRQEKTGKLLIE